MKWKLTAFISAIAFCLGCLFWSLVSGTTSNPSIKIVDKVQHKTEYIYVPVTPQEYKMCYDSKIHIDMKVNDDIATVFASDKCKRSEAEFRLSVFQSGNFKYYIGGAFVAGLLVALAVH